MFLKIRLTGHFTAKDFLNIQPFHFMIFLDEAKKDCNDYDDDVNKRLEEYEE